MAWILEKWFANSIFEFLVLHCIIHPIFRFVSLLEVQNIDYMALDGLLITTTIPRYRSRKNKFARSKIKFNLKIQNIVLKCRQQTFLMKTKSNFDVGMNIQTFTKKKINIFLYSVFIENHLLTNIRVIGPDSK